MSFDGDAHQLTSCTDAGPGEELLERRFDGALRDAKLLPDLLVTEALKHIAQDTSFSCAQRITIRFSTILPCACDQNLHQARVDPGLSLHDSTDSLDQLCKWTALQKDTGNSIVQRTQHNHIADATGDHKDWPGKTGSLALIQKLSAGLLSKVIVEQDQIDLFSGYNPECFFDGGARSNNFAFGVGFEQSA